MKAEDLDKLLDQLAEALAAQPNARVAIVGRAPATARIIGFLASLGLSDRLIGLYAPDGSDAPDAPGKGYAALGRLASDRPDVVIVSEDAGKEDLLVALVAHVAPGVRILIGGYGHLAFRDPVFHEVVRNALVPSLANGYPNCLIHLYQCLQLAARLGLSGVVAEFGSFRGGTTMLLSRFVETVGARWKVIGFDTFDGFPKARSILDMYAHHDCVFRDESAVRSYLRDRDVELVVGDVVDTVARLSGEDVVLAFVDTDNHTSASAILDVVADRVVVGGAIVFDHWAGRNRHLYTVGERIAAKRLADDRRYFNLHDTGVFLRLA
ncbi:class I SAM-dependent methyltransferase [Methylobacterium terricola]|uniref:Class I SAM-dependent methyltransferase n=1 Tax=Methylobacterium terricola TaxID=2583531 RepID=A0A5C4LGZ6_9HYPH|nr:class I SAM-dependent methyltransferase [Methylobacterium terricola]TNC11689.1 class I SAM-dependent methyltransferase [Methylobacterium terricola]